MSQRSVSCPVWIWALPAAGHNAMLWLVMVYLLKYSTDVLGVGPALVGALFGLGRCWDALSDPLVGYWSDRSRHRLGRRRPWIAWAALPTSLAFVALWSPPEHLAGAALAAWIGGALLLLYTGFTAFAVPHASLGAELSGDSHQRTRIFAMRSGFEVAGILIAVLGVHALEQASAPRETAWRVALAIGGLSALLMLACALRVRERPEHRGRGGLHPLRAFADVWRNEYARRLLLIFFLGELGVASLASVLPYVSQYILGIPGRSGLLLLAFLFPGALSIPLWVPFARRLGKRNAWLLACVVATLCYASFAFLDGGQLGLVLGVVALLGFTQGATRTLPNSIKADVIDVDELRTGERKEGAYFAAWNLAEKAAGGVSIALAGVVLELAGAGGGGEVSPFGVRLVASALPAGLLGAVCLLLARFRFGEREHRAVRDQLAAVPRDAAGRLLVS